MSSQLSESPIKVQKPGNMLKMKLGEGIISKVISSVKRDVEHMNELPSPPILENTDSIFKSRVPTN